MGNISKHQDHLKKKKNQVNILYKWRYSERID